LPADRTQTPEAAERPLSPAGVVERRRGTVLDDEAPAVGSVPSGDPSPSPPGIPVPEAPASAPGTPSAASVLAQRPALADAPGEPPAAS